MHRQTVPTSRVQRLALVFSLCLLAQPLQGQPGFGQDWQKTNTPLFGIIGMPGSWNGTPLAAYDVIGHVMHDGVQYRSYVGGSDGSRFSIGLWSTATLETGWAAHPGNPVLASGAPGTWDEAGVANPTVILDEGTYKMWYSGYDANLILRIGHATSADGVVWEKFENNPVFDVTENGWDGYHLHTPYVVRDGDTYRMWYAGHDQSGGDWGIGYATSPDGIQWTRASSDPILVPEESWEFMSIHTPIVLQEQGKFLMWYGGQDADFSNGGIVQTGFATSSDGVTWDKDPQNPILKIGGPNSRDELVALGLGVFKTDASTYSMVYGGISPTYFGGMLATLSTTTTVKEIDNRAAGFTLEQNYPNPFNPATHIRFTLPEARTVRLEVYNSLGETVATLVDERRGQGTHEVTWTPGDLPGGLYLYRLTAGSLHSTRTLLLLK